MLTETQLREQSERQINETFGAWLDRPKTRLIMSQIPAGDNKETLSVLLRSAFDAGVGCGLKAAECDVCGQRRLLTKCWPMGIETYACDECRNDRGARGYDKEKGGLKC